MSEVNINPNSHLWYKSPLLLGWLFLVLAAMAGTIFMVIQANSGFPGLVVDDFYERGQDYEENIQKKLDNNKKWNTIFDIDEIFLNQSTTIKILFTDSSGAPATPDEVTLFAYRPANSTKDFNVPMALIVKEGMAKKGAYQATITFEAKGKWDLLASMKINGVEVNYAQSIFVKD